MVGKLLSSLKNRGSFTTIELLMVVTIMSLFAAFAIPQFNKSYQNIKYKSTVNNIVSFLRVAQETTLTKNNLIEVKFYPQDNKIEMKSKNQLLETLAIPDTVEIETTLFRLLFERTGGIIIFDSSFESAEPSGYFFVKDRSKTDRKTKVILFSTGLIKTD